MAFIADRAMQLLDFSKKLDVTLLDGVVDCFYNGAGDNVSALLCSYSKETGLDCKRRFTCGEGLL